ncbi:MAG: metal-sulfur cluster assembly factor [Ignavibacteriaceae bacterium]
MADNQEIFELLKSVIDPEIGINIVDLGLVYDVVITDEAVSVTMTITTPGCPMHNSITSWVENTIKHNFPDKQVFVNLVWEPQWSPEKMTDDAREQLGI